MIPRERDVDPAEASRGFFGDTEPAAWLNQHGVSGQSWITRGSWDQAVRSTPTKVSTRIQDRLSAITIFFARSALGPRAIRNQGGVQSSACVN